MCEWLRNLELALNGSPVRTRHYFEPHYQLQELERARAYSAKQRSQLELFQAGIITAEELRQNLGLPNLQTPNTQGGRRN